MDIVKLLRDAYLLAETQSSDPVTKNGAILESTYAAKPYEMATRD